MLARHMSAVLAVSGRDACLCMLVTSSLSCLPPPAELRIEDVVGDVVDLTQAADPQHITATGTAAAACWHHVA